MLSTDTNNVNSADDKGDQNIEKKEIIQDKDLIRSKTVKHKHRRPSICTFKIIRN